MTIDWTQVVPPPDPGAISLSPAQWEWLVASDADMEAAIAGTLAMLKVSDRPLYAQLQVMLSGRRSFNLPTVWGLVQQLNPLIEATIGRQLTFEEVEARFEAARAFDPSADPTFPEAP